MALKSSREGLRKELVDYLGNIIIDENLKQNIINSVDDVFVNNEELIIFVNELDGKISNESSARESADNTLQNNINVESLARESADNTLQNNINVESTARQEAVTNIEDLINNGVLKVDLLWTNASPTSSFSKQTITLDLSNYKMISVVLRFSTTIDVLISWFGKKNSVIYSTMANPTIKYRSFNVFDTSIFIDDCYYSASTYASETIDNTFLIPYQIYGVR